MSTPSVIEFKNLVAKVDGTVVSLNTQNDQARAFSASNAHCEAVMRKQIEIDQHAISMVNLVNSMVTR